MSKDDELRMILCMVKGHPEHGYMLVDKAIKVIEALYKPSQKKIRDIILRKIIDTQKDRLTIASGRQYGKNFNTATDLAKAICEGDIYE